MLLLRRSSICRCGVCGRMMAVFVVEGARCVREVVSPGLRVRRVSATEELGWENCERGVRDLPLPRHDQAWRAMKRFVGRGAL
jgi:hypothetical protein